MGKRQLNRRRADGRAERARLRPRHGLSLIEVMVALGILGGVMLGLGMFTAKMSQATSGARLRITASQAAQERLDSVKTAPRYTAIESLFVATETVLDTKDPKRYAGFKRQTWVTRVGGKVTDTTDYKLVTVQVTNPQMSGSVRKTTVISFY
jgi:prepilin-type N-terminal cleavage/methylation domain-containing protein